MKEDTYYRFNIEGLDVELYEYEAIEKMSAYTNEYIARNEVELAACTRHMAGIVRVETIVEDPRVISLPDAPDGPLTVQELHRRKM